LRDGFARCVDWSIALVSGGAEKLRAAEKAAKEKKMRIWKDYTPSAVHSVQKYIFFNFSGCLKLFLLPLVECQGQTIFRQSGRNS